jgi:hypothetical protein
MVSSEVFQNQFHRLYLRVHSAFGSVKTILCSSVVLLLTSINHTLKKRKGKVTNEKKQKHVNGKEVI